MIEFFRKSNIGVVRLLILNISPNSRHFSTAYRSSEIFNRPSKMRTNEINFICPFGALTLYKLHLSGYTILRIEKH